MADNLADLLEEQARRKGEVTGGTRSVLAEPEDTTTLEEIKRATTALLKGSTKGIIDLVGGWGKLYDVIKENKTPSALSGEGIVNAIAKAGGPDLMQIQGYKGLYQAGQAGAPAVALSAAGLPGMFSRTPLGLAGEGAVAGGTGLAAQAIAPDSPFAQLAIQTLPYAVKGGIGAAKSAVTAPTGQIPSNIDSLLNVGRMTPGEATGSRVQLAKEAIAEVSPKIESTGNLFRQAQAQDVGGFLATIFKRSTTEAADPTVASNAAINAFNNYGKALSGQLRKDANVDFNAAKKAGGLVSTDPVVNIIQSELASIPPEIAALQPMRSALQRIIDEYVIPAKEAIVEPSTILGPTGQPAYVNITKAEPQQLSKISIDRLQKNLSAWGEAAYSGTADFGKGNIFEGVAPGQARGIALKVLRGFRESLDNAVDSGVAGATDLAKARDKFKTNLQKIEDYSNYPITKYFDVETATALTPELVIDRLSKAKPSERLFLSQVLAKSPDGNMVLDTVRRSQFEEVLNKAQKAAAGAAEGSPILDMKTLLTELNNKKGSFNYLFPQAEDKADALLAIQWLQKTAKTASEASKGMQSDAYGAARSLGGSSQQGLIAREIVSLADMITKDPRAMADVVFNPETVKKMAEAQRKGKLTKAADLAALLGSSAAKFAPRVGPFMSSTEQPTEQQTVQTPMEAQTGQDELAALLKEQARRQGQLQ